MNRNGDFLQYINERGSVTTKELAEKFNISVHTAATWLSRNKTNGTLVRTEPERGLRDVRDPPRLEGRYSLSHEATEKLSYYLM